MVIDKLKRSVHIISRVKSENEKGYYIVDTQLQNIEMNLVKYIFGILCIIQIWRLKLLS